MAPRSRFITLLSAVGITLVSYIPMTAQQTRILTAEKHNEYGLVYSLPITALEIEVSARKEVLTAGPYAAYARKYIGTDKVITHDAERWTITDVKVKTYGTLDTDAKYIMQLKPGALTFIGVSEDGMLLSINKEPASLPKPANNRPEAPVKLFDGKEYLKYVDEDFTASQSTAKQAQMLSESLMEARDAHISLTRGTADNMPVDGRQLELMLNSLQAQEDALTAAFTGTVTAETVTNTYTYLPEDNGKEILFRFADFKGFTEPDDLAGFPVYINVAITAQGELPVDANGNVKMLPKDAVRYCIPGSAQISLTAEGKKLFAKEFDFSQFGVEFGLNPSLFTDRKEPSYAVFNPTTGAIVEIGSARELKRQDD
ncbi:MAG: DUF4831 family protein [Muribaculaceae bacterium]|nr:DUF4831 family protein [Muribaculaceae bacterium]